MKVVQLDFEKFTIENVSYDLHFEHVHCIHFGHSLVCKRITSPTAAVEETRIIGESPRYGTNLPVSFGPLVMHSMLMSHVSHSAK